jgi:homoserine kinase
MRRARAFAPATVSNLGPGFDVLGLALERPGDIVEAEARTEPGVEIVEVTGTSVLSTDPAKNVTGVAATAALRCLDGRPPGAQATPSRGVRLWLHKQMPLASGLGSSAASSVAGALAASAAHGATLSKQDLIRCALEGERAASGAAHADNVAPSVLGGIVLVRSYRPLDLIALPVPAALRIVVVHPHCEVVTADARKLVSAHRFDIRQVVANLGNVAALVDALHRGNLDQLGRCISDALVEPLRAPLVPGFDTVKQAALGAGAHGCSLSGSGPSVFAFATSDAAAARIGDAMRAAFQAEGHLDSEVYTGPVNRQGATVL